MPSFSTLLVAGAVLRQRRRADAHERLCAIGDCQRDQLRAGHGRMGSEEAQDGHAAQQVLLVEGERLHIVTHDHVRFHTIACGYIKVTCCYLLLPAATYR